MQGIEFLNQFKNYGISHDAKDKRFQFTLDFQDFIGHMDFKDLNEFYSSLDQEYRGLFIWACSCCLSFDSMITVLKSTTVTNLRRKLYDEFDKDCAKRELDLFQKKQTFNDCKKHIHRKIACLKNEIETLKDRIEWHITSEDTLRNSNNQLRRRLRESELKAANFDNIKAAFSLILETD